MCTCLFCACHRVTLCHYLPQDLTLFHVRLLPTESWKHTSEAPARLLSLPERSPKATSRTQEVTLLCASKDLSWPANLPQWRTPEQAVTTLIHQVLAVLDLSPEVAQILVLSPVLLLEVLELQDQQEFLLIDDHQPLVIILSCRGMEEVRERGAHLGSGRMAIRKEGTVLANYKTGDQKGMCAAWGWLKRRGPGYQDMSHGEREGRSEGHTGISRTNKRGGAVVKS